MGNWKRATGIIRGLSACCALASSTALASGAALAAAGQPSPGQLGFQDPATQMMRDIISLHDLVNYIIIAITAFVLLLLLIVIVRFNAKANPVPSKFTHNTTVEVLWTVVPILILLVIAVPSFKLLYAQYTYPKPDVTIKATGNAWFWEHEYPDLGGVKITSNMLRDEDVLIAELGKDEFARQFGKLEDGTTTRTKALYEAASKVWVKRGEPRQLAVDQEIAVPVGKVVHMLVTSNDVIHSWTIPSFGSKIQAVPGRLTSTWFKPEKVGVYYGQCSVLCGKEHASMPIAIRVVPQTAFDQWLVAVKARDSKKAKEILKLASEAPTAPRFANAGQ
jgi:cytochrome c oxidase subunit 2